MSRTQRRVPGRYAGSGSQGLLVQLTLTGSICRFVVYPIQAIFKGVWCVVLPRIKHTGRRGRPPLIYLTMLNIDTRAIIVLVWVQLAKAQQCSFGHFSQSTIIPCLHQKQCLSPIATENPRSPSGQSPMSFSRKTLTPRGPSLIS